MFFLLNRIVPILESSTREPTVVGLGEGLAWQAPMVIIRFSRLIGCFTIPIGIQLSSSQGRIREMSR